MYMGNRLLDVTSVPSGSITPTAGINGQVFFNTTTSDLLVWNSTQWIAIKGSDTIPHGSALPPSADVAGLYYLTSDQKVYVWTGISWRPLGGAAYGVAVPPTGQFGDMFYNTTDGLLYVWNGTAWVTLGARGYSGSQGVRGYSGSIGAIGFTGSAGSYNYTPVNKAGDTMTGPLILNGNPTNSAQAANKAYVDAVVAPKFNTPNGTTSQYVRGNGSLAILNAETIGLGNVNNTSDANKPVSTAQQNALNTKYNVTGGNLTGSMNMVVSGATMTWTGAGNQHLWARNADGSERGVIWNDGNTNQWNLRVRSGPTWTFSNDSHTYLPGNLRLGSGAWMYADGNLGGAIWQNWGSWYAFQAIDARITARASVRAQEWMTSRNSTDVGTYILASCNRGVARNEIIGGNELGFWRPDQDGGTWKDGSPQGTWRNMGASIGGRNHATIFMRVW